MGEQPLGVGEELPLAQQSIELADGVLGFEERLGLVGQFEQLANLRGQSGRHVGEAAGVRSLDRGSSESGSLSLLAPSLSAEESGRKSGCSAGVAFDVYAERRRPGRDPVAMGNESVSDGLP